MNLEDLILQTLKKDYDNLYKILDNFYLPLDKQHILRTRNISLIPNENNRRGGKYSYAEWAHVIGIFQTLIFLNLKNKEDNVILDVGCGTGLLAIASEPYIGKNGKYIGIDVMEEDIEFCRNHYPSDMFEFIHLDVANAAYAPDQQLSQKNWPLKDNTVDLVTALSVWTHLNEQDAIFYFKEISRVLKTGGRAIITFFLLDDAYKQGLSLRSKQQSRFHMTLQDQWIFDQPAYGSSMWFTTDWAEVPENAIGVNKEGLELLIKSSGLKLVEHYQGNWKEIPAIFFQDILIFQKP